MKVAIGSKNPVKIAAVQEAFEKVWPGRSFEFDGVEVLSGVSDQPMSDEESITGATNRARRAREQKDADFGVGLEGGIQKIGERWFDCGWIVVTDRDGKLGVGSSIRMIVPQKMMALILSGKELGEVVDIVFGTKNAKQAEGHFGLMTNKGVTRKDGYRDGVIAALPIFITSHVF